jgi:hypothetical protein
MNFNEVQNDLNNLIHDGWKVLVRSSGAIVAALLTSFIKVHLTTTKMTFAQSFTQFIISFAIGSGVAIFSENSYYAVLAALIGDRVVQYIMFKFDSKNISDTMKSFFKINIGK